MSLQSFTAAYIGAALWASSYGGNGEHCLGDGTHDLAPECRAQMELECKAFYEEHRRLFAAENDERAGHDFWLTRCSHGAGFWDGHWQEPAATTLTEASEKSGARDLYVGDDGLIHCCSI